MADPQTADQGFLAGLLGKFGADPAAAYGGLLSDPATQRQFGLRSLGAAAQAMAQASMPVPYKGGTPWGSFLGSAGGAAATAGDELIKARLEAAQTEQAQAQAGNLQTTALVNRALLGKIANPPGMFESDTGSGTGAKPLTGPAKIIAGQGGGKAISSTTADTSLPPEARALLDTIAGPESNGAYNVRWGGPSGDKTFDSYAAHPNIPEPGPQGDSTAAGRYQIVNKTWKPLQAKYGFGDFTPVTQDQAGWHLAADTYKEQTGRDLLTDLQAGKTDQVASALHGQWSTLNMGSYGQNLGKYQGGSGASPQTASTGDQPPGYKPQDASGGAYSVPPPPGPPPKPGEYAIPVRAGNVPLPPAAAPTAPVAPLPGGALPPGVEGAPGPVTGLLGQQPVQVAAAGGVPRIDGGLLAAGGSNLSPAAAVIAQGIARQQAGGGLPPGGAVAGPGAPSGEVPPAAAPAVAPADAAAARAAAMGQESGGAGIVPGLINQPPPASAPPAPPPTAPPTAAPTAPPVAPSAPPPMLTGPPGTKISNAYIQWAQDVAQLYAMRGTAAPAQIAAAATLPFDLAKQDQDARVKAFYDLQTAGPKAGAVAAAQQPYTLNTQANKALWDIYVAQQKPREPQREGTFAFNPQTNQYTLNRNLVEADGSTHQHLSILDQNMRPLSDYDAGPIKASPGSVAAQTRGGEVTQTPIDLNKDVMFPPGSAAANQWHDAQMRGEKLPSNVQIQPNGSVQITATQPTGDQIAKNQEEFGKLRDAAFDARNGAFEMQELRKTLNGMGAQGPATPFYSSLSSWAISLGLTSNADVKKYLGFSPANEAAAEKMSQDLLGAVLKAQFPQRITNADITTWKDTVPRGTMLRDAYDMLMDRVLMPKFENTAGRYAAVAGLPNSGDPQLRTFNQTLETYDKAHPLTSYIHTYSYGVPDENGIPHRMRWVPSGPGRNQGDWVDDAKNPVKF